MRRARISSPRAASSVKNAARCRSSSSGARSGWSADARVWAVRARTMGREVAHVPAFCEPWAPMVVSAAMRRKAAPTGKHATCPSSASRVHHAAPCPVVAASFRCVVEVRTWAGGVAHGIITTVSSCPKHLTVAAYTVSRPCAMLAASSALCAVASRRASRAAPKSVCGSCRGIIAHAPIVGWCAIGIMRSAASRDARCSHSVVTVGAGP